MSGVFDFIGGLFGGRKEPAPLPTPEPPPAPPSVDDAAKTRDEADAKKRKKGRAASVLTGSSGAGLPQTATKALLGE